MKKFQTITLVLCAMAVFSAVFVGSASGETTLLAEWLANGAPITSSLRVETIEWLKLGDTGTLVGLATVGCSLIFEGTVGANGEGEVTEILTLSRLLVGGLPTGLPLLGTGGVGPDCGGTLGCAEGTAASPIEVWPVGLPWKTLLFLMENGEFLELIYGHMNTEGKIVPFGYELLCLVVGLNAEDLCTQSDGEVLVENSPVTGDASTPANSAVTPNANCTQSGGEASGVNETIGGSGKTLISGELLTVSSE